MPSFVTLIIAALATHRLSLMIAEEEGPFSIFVKLRGRLDPDQTTWIGRGLNCIFCVGFWVALPIALCVLFDLTWMLIWPAIADAVVIMRRWEQKK
jgi:hypothetical protein